MLDNLSKEIELRALQEGSYIEAIKDYCELHEILDFEDVTEQLHPNVIDKIKAEFIDKHYFPDKSLGNNLSKFMN